MLNYSSFKMLKITRCTFNEVVAIYEYLTIVEAETVKAEAEKILPLPHHCSLKIISLKHGMGLPCKISGS